MTLFKHSLPCSTWQFPFPSSEIPQAAPLVACLFLYLKRPRPVKFKTSTSFSVDHELFLWSPGLVLALRVWIGRELFRPLWHHLLLVSLFCFGAQGEGRGVVAPGIDISDRRGDFPAPPQRPARAWTQTLPLNWGSWMYFYRGLLGWIFVPHSSHVSKMDFSLNPLQQLLLVVHHTASQCQGPFAQ